MVAGERCTLQKTENVPIYVQLFNPNLGLLAEFRKCTAVLENFGENFGTGILFKIIFCFEKVDTMVHVFTSIGMGVFRLGVGQRRVSISG